jgi:hypothetical protein
MRRCIFAIVVTLVAGSGSVALSAPGASAAVTDTQATISCNDGHSAVLGVDQATLTSLVSAIQAINTGGAMSCSLATAPSAETSEWTVYDYNPSGQEIAPRNSPNSQPATTPDAGVTWQFPFRSDKFTALFTTTDRSMTGDESGATLTDRITVSGDAASFMTQHGGGDCVGNTPAAVRFYFTSPSASGSSVGTPPAGFYTAFWWSNPVNLQLISGSQSGTIIAHMANPSEWSDWNGQSGANPAVTAAFVRATQRVQSIGLSFGGECFFETGVTPTTPFTSEQFSSTFSES